jgi:hypothetical protein
LSSLFGRGFEEPGSTGNNQELTRIARAGSTATDWAGFEPQPYVPPNGDESDWSSSDDGSVLDSETSKPRNPANPSPVSARNPSPASFIGRERLSRLPTFEEYMSNLGEGAPDPDRDKGVFGFMTVGAFNYSNHTQIDMGFLIGAIEASRGLESEQKHQAPADTRAPYRRHSVG